MKLYNLDNLTCDDCRHQRNGKCTGGSWFCDHMEMFALSGEAMKRREVEADPVVHAHCIIDWLGNPRCSNCGCDSVNCADDKRCSQCGAYLDGEDELE